MLITAIYKAALVSLSHALSPINFLSKVFKYPINERPYLIFSVGYPQNPIYVLDIYRKDLKKVSDFYL